MGPEREVCEIDEMEGSLSMLGDDDLCAAFVEIGDDTITVEGLVGDQSAELDALE